VLGLVGIEVEGRVLIAITDKDGKGGATQTGAIGERIPTGIVLWHVYFEP
jgi:hypothetical protein